MNLPKLKWWQWALVIFFGLWFLGRMGSTPTKTTPKNIVSKSEAVEWYVGGNLHNATVGQWKVASERNKLATAADWLAATKWKEKLNSPEDFNKMKVKAGILVNAVNESIKFKNDEKIDHLEITEIATALMLMTKDFDP